VCRALQQNRVSERLVLVSAAIARSANLSQNFQQLVSFCSKHFSKPWSGLGRTGNGTTSAPPCTPESGLELGGEMVKLVMSGFVGRSSEAILEGV
jgi:hypothetical protein